MPRHLIQLPPEAEMAELTHQPRGKVSVRGHGQAGANGQRPYLKAAIAAPPPSSYGSQGKYTRSGHGFLSPGSGMSQNSESGM